MTAVDSARRNLTPLLSRAVSIPAAGLGRFLGVPLAALARRRHGKPMHPRGVVRRAVLERTGSTPSWGVPWLDEPGQEEGVVRLSRGAGLPPPLPDVMGLALRVPGPDGEPVELLLSSTGGGRLSRLLPAPRRNPATVYGSIMGYRTDAGTLRLSAVAERTARRAGEDLEEELVFVLAAARGPGPSRPFARLTLGAEQPPGDPDVRFDAVLHPPPGMVADGPMARLRAPAYAMARAGRDDVAG